MPSDNSTSPTNANLVAHYKRLLKKRELSGALESRGGLEGDSGEPDLSSPAIDERIDSTWAELHRIVKQHLGDRADLHEIADQIAAAGHESLEALSHEAPEDLSDIDELSAALEVIVRTDGRHDEQSRGAVGGRGRGQRRTAKGRGLLRGQNRRAEIRPGV